MDFLIHFGLDMKKYPHYASLFVMAALALAGCNDKESVAQAQESAKTTSAVEAKPTQAASEHAPAPASENQADSSGLPFPSDGCSQEASTSFFEWFVYADPKQREKYIAKELIGKVEPFKIGLVDYRWVYTGANSSGNELVEVTQKASPNAFDVTFVKAEFNDEDEVVKRIGKPGVYQFKLIDGCWKLTGEKS